MADYIVKHKDLPLISTAISWFYGVVEEQTATEEKDKETLRTIMAEMETSYGR